MIKTHTNQQGKQFVFVAVPDSSINHNVYMGYLIFKEPNYQNWITDDELCNPIKTEKFLKRTEGKSAYKDRALKLPFDNLKIIGLAKELTEEQWKEISPLPAIMPKFGDPFKYVSAKESGLSLIKSLGFKETDNVLTLEVI